MSRATRDDAPWKVWPEEMMKKSALRRLAKMLPSGRNILPDDDDLPSISGPTLTPLPTPSPRAPGAAAALDQFAGNPDAPPSGGPSPSTNPPAEETSGGVDSESGSGAAPSVPDEGHAANSPLTPHGEELAEAYERGRQAKEGGFARKALPGEYREPDRQRESIAWQAGYDGKAMPEWSAS